MIILAGAESKSLFHAPGPHAVIERQITVGDWTLSVGDEGAALFERQLEVTDTTYRIEVEAVVDFDPECGSVRLEARDASGSVIEGAVVNFRSVGPGLGARVSGYKHGLDRVPVGEYVTEVRAGSYLDTLWFPAQGRVAVRANEESTLAVVLHQGGRFELSVSGLAEEDRERATRARISVSGSGEPDLITSFRLPVGDGHIRIGHFSFGEQSELSPLLEVGTYLLRVEVEGYMPAERTLTIGAGQVAEVALDLVR